MKTISYKIGCKWCNATGYTMQWYSPNNALKESTTALTNVCPVCNGSGTIIATETIYDSSKSK